MNSLPKRDDRVAAAFTQRLPALADDKSWNLTSLELRMLGSYALARNFIAFSCAAVLAALFVVLIPRRDQPKRPVM